MVSMTAVFYIFATTVAMFVLLLIFATLVRIANSAEVIAMLYVQYAEDGEKGDAPRTVLYGKDGPSE